MEEVCNDEVNAVVEKVLKEWYFQAEPRRESLELGAKIYLAIKEK